KRAPEPVLVGAGRLADEHHARVGAALPRHERCARLARLEAARQVRADLGRDRIQALLARHARNISQYARATIRRVYSVVSVGSASWANQRACAISASSSASVAPSPSASAAKPCTV